MDGIVIFSSANSHPLAFLLNRSFRHVWCALRDEDRGVWVSCNWHQGVPVIQVEAGCDFDLAAYYEEKGYTVIAMRRGEDPPNTPVVLNNCVGYVKVAMAIRSWALTPYQLYRHLTKELTT